MALFTKGPWRRLTAGDEFADEIAAEGVDRWTTVGVLDRPVALVISSNADDRLICAAPDLYEALILVTGTLIDRAADEQDVIQRAQLAIAKAEGRAP